MPFNSQLAKFNILNGKKTFLGQIKQKVVFELDEEGAKAAAATGIDAPTSASPAHDYLAFDRPFMYVITENATGAILFIGVITSL